MRMICSYAGVTIKDNQYEVHGTSENWNRDEWFVADKPDLLKLNPLINLPYIKDGSLIITQSNACLKYLGNKYGLNGNEVQNNQCLE